MTPGEKFKATERIDYYNTNVFRLFEDAIEVALSVGLQELSVDSLYIIQYYMEAWRKEASHIG